ncbi:MAG TPA: hypothetical protein VGR00_12380, partial [Thermoanaerobaculia bacterium]|nr:hypothetical protein [Thermoanaerobaculia bacterium]
MPARKEEPPATVCPMGQRDVLSTLRERERAVTFARLKGRPYGFDVDGRPITQVKGKLIHAAVEALFDSVAERSREETPFTSSRSGRKHRQEAAKREALDALV